MSPNDTEQPELQPLDDWLLEPHRSETFQAFLDSLEPERKRRVRERPYMGDYATYRG